MQALPELSVWELVVRVLIAAALGGLIGFEREYRDQPAGFRTHILVAVGAALFTLVGAYGARPFFDAGSETILRFDPTRVAAQIVTGIGFLGAGAILRQGLNVRGLTTAAALWVTAAIGTAAGFGYWQGAVAAAAVALGALYGLKALEHTLFRSIRRGRVTFDVETSRRVRFGEVSQVFEAHRARLLSLQIEDSEEDRDRLEVRVALPPHLGPDVLREELLRLDGVTGVEYRD